MADVSRRGVLCALTAAGASVLTGCRTGEQAPRLVAQLPSGWAQGEEQWVTTTCGQCPAGCGIRVRVYEGRAVKIEGNPLHPINQGGVGPKGQAGLQLLYHPDRIRGPLRRVGPRGGGQWISITWDTAIADIARELQRIRADGQAHSVVVIDGEPRGIVPRLWERFLHAYGSPNHVTHASTGDAGTALALSFMQGASDNPAYDWEHTDYALGFGVSLFESWCQTIHLSRASATMRRGTPGKRAKFVHVSPRYSVTAAKADEWVPIAPATYGALALGLAHVLVRDNLIDREFVRDHTFGFDTWRDADGREHRGFRDLVIADYPPEKVAHITGVEVAVIERIAREMSAHRPAIALGDGDAAGATNGLGTAMAIHALNALLGSVERRGGVLAHRPVLGPFAAFDPDETARTGLRARRIDAAGSKECPLGNGAIQHLPAAILSSRPYPINALILYRSNPIFSKPAGRSWVDAIRKVPLVVSCSPLPDESTLFADYVVPDHTYLERAEIVEPAPSCGRPLLGLRQPAVAPRFNTLATSDLVIRLAHALPQPVAAAFPWNDASEAIESLGERTSMTSDMRKNGGWWGDQQFERWDEAFTTPSKRFEFYSQAIASRLATLFPGSGELERHLISCGVTTRGDDLCLPHWEPAHHAGDPREYPFLLVPYRAINYAEGGVRHLPWLRELPAAGRFAWSEIAELNPEDARQFEVEDGDAIVIESPVGSRTVRVRVHAGTPRGLAGLPLGHGPWPINRTEVGSAGGQALLAVLSDPLAGIFARQGTRVRIRKEVA